MQEMSLHCGPYEWMFTKKQFDCRNLLDKGEENPSKSSVAIAKEESMDCSLFYKTLSLVNLAPDIIEGIMSDPPTFDFSVKKIFSHRLPADWNEQRKFLGLPEKDYAVG